MKYFKQGLMLLSGIYIFSSCQKSDLVGLDQTDFIQGKDTTLTVNAITTEEDSVFTNGLSQHPFGFIEDPILGSTEANLAFALSLPSEGFTFGSSPTLDSAVLVLKYGDEFYGDSTLSSTFVVNVHQLNEKYESRSYSNRKNWSITPNPAGSKTVKRFSWGDSTFVTQIVKGKQDTVVRVAPQLRIKLDDAFINTNFVNTAASNLATNTAFINHIKGLYLTLGNKTFPEGKGGITFFDLATAGGSKLEIYYKTTSTENVKDTLMASFGISGNTAAANIKHVYKPAIQAQLDNPPASNETIYLKPLGGLRGKISLEQDLAKLRAKGKSVAINKAELVVTLVEGTYDNPFKPAPRLTLYRTDIAGLRKPVPDNAIGLDARYISEGLFGGFYNSTKKEYRFIITSYIQDLLKGNLKDYGTYLAPINKRLTGSYNINPSANTAGRAVVGGDSNSPYKMKINIIYTMPE